MVKQSRLLAQAIQNISYNNMYKKLSYLFFGRQKHPQPKTLYKAGILVLSYIGENPRSRSSVLSRHLPPRLSEAREV